MNHKKSHQDKIDIFFLLNQKQILTKNELNNVLPLQNYEDYQVSFYKRRLTDFFLKNYSCDWFYATYLDTMKVIRYHDFNIDGEYMVIHNVSNYHSEATLRDILQKVDGFRELYLFRPDPTKSFRRDCYAKMEGVDIEEKYEEVRMGLNDFKLEFSRVKIQAEERQMATENLEDVVSLLKSICKLYNTTLEEVTEIQINSSPHKDPSKGDFYLHILKNVFLYDYSTSQQFLSDLEYHVKNGKPQGNSNRRRELTLNYIDFSRVRNVSFDFLLGRIIEKVDDSVFLCSLCDKKFESEEFATNHQKNKHAEDLKKRMDKYKHFSTFIDSLDLFILNLVEGSLEDTPWFFNKRDERVVVYDMNHVFSGDIVIEY